MARGPKAGQRDTRTAFVTSVEVMSQVTERSRRWNVSVNDVLNILVNKGIACEDENWRPSDADRG